MKKYLTIILALAMTACSKVGPDHPYDSVDFFYGKNLPHDEIVLGGKLENPFKTGNMQNAYDILYPTKGRQPVETTDLYVRFLPTDQQQYETLEGLGLNLVDHPLDYEVLRDGDWYRDPTLPEESITWQYAVVKKDFKFPEDIRYEIIDECFLAENAPSSTRSMDVDWDEVERLSYELTGNTPLTKSDGEAVKAAPSGRISIVDPKYAGGKPLGVSGVMVVCNSFMKFDKCYTDRDGYYAMKKQFDSEVHYRLVFKNEKDFNIGFNFILLPASISTMGTADPRGINLTVTQDSETKLYTRSVVNNAAYDYACLCEKEELGLPALPKDIRIWIFNRIEPSSCVMMHHGTVVDMACIASLLGAWSALVTIFAPDITIGTSASKSYDSIYATVIHELSHASHFSKVGTKFWDEYITYILSSFATTGDMYGNGSGDRAGYCEVGEMWAYYLQARVFKERYGGSFPSFGTSEWFHPQIFRYLDERGLGPGEIAAALESDVISREGLRDRLISLYPSKKKIIDQVFNRYN